LISSEVVSLMWLHRSLLSVWLGRHSTTLPFSFLGFISLLSLRFFALGFENRDEPSESTLVVVAGSAVAVSIDPFRVLREQVFVQLPLQLAIGSS